MEGVTTGWRRDVDGDDHPAVSSRTAAARVWITSRDLYGPQVVGIYFAALGYWSARGLSVPMATRTPSPGLIGGGAFFWHESLGASFSAWRASAAKRESRAAARLRV